jgi:hypothetical protein
MIPQEEQAAISLVVLEKAEAEADAFITPSAPNSWGGGALKQVWPMVYKDVMVGSYWGPTQPTYAHRVHARRVP